MTCLAHYKYWFKNKLKAMEIIIEEDVQEALQKALKGLPVKDIEEFNCLLENSRKLYTF